MNKANLKSYAPEARKDFIAAVTARANRLGLSEKAGQLEVTPAQTQGDVTLIAGQAWPAKVATQRDQLITRMRREGFAHTCEAVAYTWFNRFAAMRYMELHDFLEHGHRVLSSRDGGLPELLRHAADVSLPGLQAAKVQELQLAGNRDDELYKQLLVAQCNELSRVMPFLFERIDDETELLLPDNLLRTDSIVAKLVAGVPEEDWQEIEVIGWLYQFYISEKKDQVIGKVVKSEDIPAATQLFTPNWIVQYLVQNSVGRLWLMANPQSTLGKEWPYYITPAEQTPEVQVQLDALIQTRVAEDGDTLNPESITVLDPACGSGHILVVAYDVLKAIYLERGYRVRDIPRLILEKNLYGLDIDDRAAQMAGFALLMKARADDRRLFTATDDAGNLQPPKLNVLSLQESKGLNVDELATHLAPHQVQRATISALVDTFEHAKTFGSLIQIPYALKTHLAVLPQVLAAVKQSGDMYATAAADDLLELVHQAQVLVMQFDAVVANPPYMGSKGMNLILKEYAKETFPSAKADLFALFIERGFILSKLTGFCSMVTMHSWMFLSSFQVMREKILQERAIHTMAHLGSRAFGEITGEIVQATAFVMQVVKNNGFKPVFLRLLDGGELEKEYAMKNGKERFSSTVQDDFNKIPGSPIAYWLGPSVHELFMNSPSFGSFTRPCAGMNTTKNSLFVRGWHEISILKIGFGLSSAEAALVSGKKFFPYNKGGGFKKWFGNNTSVINYENNGKTICDYIDFESGSKVNSTGRIINRDKYFKPSVTWSAIASKVFSVRKCDQGFLFDNGGSSAFPQKEYHNLVLAFLSSKPIFEILSSINPTLNFQPGNISALPFNFDLLYPYLDEIDSNTEKIVTIAKKEWNLFEHSWDFETHPLVARSNVDSLLGKSWGNWCQDAKDDFLITKNLEVRNNEIFINSYRLKEDFSPTVTDDQITLYLCERELDAQSLVSYAIGCMMGRYSLDEPGLIYAHAGNVGFDPSRYIRFAADADGILPITDEHWFDDDAPARVRDFLQVVWGPETLAENMAWLAESLGGKASETPEETIRRYMADKFYKDHLQTYKKRPIYWLFSSGKQGAFQALVYLHRYNEGTLARLRAQYVVPLTSKMQSRIDMLQKDALAASSTAARNKLNKDVEKLKKKHAELLAYDEQLRHYADMRINLDLDDGVKANYGKFGDLLEGVKLVTGGAGDE